MFRIIGQILVKDNNAVQSTNFKNILPLGKFDIAFESIQDKEPDEINIIDINGNINEFLNNNQLLISKCSYPLSVGGGLYKSNITNDAVDRLVYNSHIFENVDMDELNNKGKQARIAYLPFIIRDNNFYVYNSTVNKFIIYENNIMENSINNYSEILLLDADNQGGKNGFNFNVLKFVNKIERERILISGGCNEQVLEKAKKIELAGVVLDNISFYHNENIYKM